MRPIRTNIYPRTEGWTGKQGNGIVTNRIIINIGGTSKQRDQCFSGIEVDKLITGKQYSGGTKTHPRFPYKISAQPDSRTRDFSRPRGYQSLIVHRRNLSRFKFPFDRSLLPRNRSSSRGQCYRSDVRENGNNEIRTNLSFSILGSLISVITNDPPKHHSLSLSLAFYATFIS